MRQVVEYGDLSICCQWKIEEVDSAAVCHPRPAWHAELGGGGSFPARSGGNARQSGLFLAPTPEETAREETLAVVEDAEAALGAEIAGYALLEARDGDGAVGDVGELETRVLPVQILVEANLFAAIGGVGGVAGELGWEVGLLRGR